MSKAATGMTRHHGTAKKLTAWLMSGALVIQQLWAPMAAAQQVITDPRAPIQFRPQITTSGNGAPVVNITKPSAGGLSHNKFQRYDIDAKGLILNNSGVSGTSIIGGKVGANPNLGNAAPAVTILNEVTSSSVSTLAGPTEVFGKRANVIVANPNGVGCVGCTFINTGNVTLATGVPRPDYATGIVRYDITGGTVSISGTGLGAATGYTLSGVDLVGSRLTVNAPVNTEGKARLIAGTGTFDAGAGSFSATGGTGSTSFAIQSSPAGTIRAGSVAVLSHDLNLGIKMLGAIQALDGAVTLQAAGDVVAHGLEAFTRISAKSGNDLLVKGNVQAGAAITLEATRNIAVAQDVGVMGLAGISAKAGRNLSSQGLFNTGGDLTIVTDGETAIANGAIMATGNIVINAGDFRTDGTGLYGADIMISAARNAIANGLIASAQSGDITITAANTTLGQGTAFESANQITVTASDTFTNALHLDLQAASNLTINFGKTLVNTETGTIIDGTFDRELSGGLVNAGLIYANTAIDAQWGTLDNQAGGTIFASIIDLAITSNAINAGEILTPGKATLTTDTFFNRGLLASDTTVDITAATLIENRGRIEAGQSILLTAPGTINDLTGELIAPLLDLNGGTVANAGQAEAEIVAANLTGAFTNIGSLNATSLFLADVRVFENLSGGTIEAPEVYINAVADIVNSGRIAAVDVAQLTAANIENTGVDAKIRSNLIAMASSQNLQNLDGAQIVALSRMSLEAETIANSGSIQAGQDLSIAANASLINSGQIKATTTVTITTSELANAAVGQISGRDVGIKATTLDTAGAITADGIVELVLFGSLTNSGKITAFDGVAVAANAFANEASGLIRGAGLWLDVKATAANRGSLIADDYIELFAQEIINDGSGARIEAVDVLLTSKANLDNTNGATIIASAGLSLSAARLSNSGTVTSGDDLEISAVSSIDNNGLLQAANLITLTTQTLTNATNAEITASTIAIDATTFENAGELSASGIIQLALRGDLSNSGQLKAGTDSVASAQTLTNMASGAWSGSSIYITSTGDIANEGEIVASERLQIVGGGRLLNQGNPGAVARLSGDSVVLDITGTLENRASSEIVAASELSAAANNLSNAGVLKSDGALFIETIKDLNNAGQINSSDALTLNTDFFTNSGRIESAADVSISAANDSGRTDAITNSGSIIAVGTLELALPTSNFHNSGLLQGASAVIVDARAMTNAAGGRVLAPSIWLTAHGGSGPGNITNHGLINGDDYIQLKGDDISNIGTAGGTTAEIRAGTVVIEAVDEFTNRTNAVIDGRDQLSISAKRTGNPDTLLASTSISAGLLVYGGDLYIAITNDPVALPDTLDISGSFVFAQSGDLTNTGTLKVGGDLLLESTGGAITNDGGSLIAGGDLSLLAFGAINNTSGILRSDSGDVYIEGTSFTNAGAGEVKNYSAIYRNRMAQGRPSWLPQLTSSSDDATFNAHNLGNKLSSCRACVFFITNGKNYVFIPQPLELAKILEARGNGPEDWGIDDWQNYAPQSLEEFDKSRWSLHVPDHNLSPTYTSAEIVMAIEGQTADVGKLAQVVTLAGDVTIKVSGNITNRNGSISSGSELQLQGRDLVNEAKALYSNVTYSIEGRGDPLPGRNLVRGVGAPWFGAAGPVYVSVPIQTLSGQIPATLAAGGKISGDLSGAVTNTGTISATTTQLTGETITNLGPNTRRLVPAALPNPVIDLAQVLGLANGGSAGSAGNVSRRLAGTASAVVPLQTRLQPGAPGTPAATALVVDAINRPGAPAGSDFPNINFLRSATRTTTPTTETPLTPASILNRVGDIRNDMTFLADPVLEQQLIRTALVQQTGRQYLDTSFENQADQQAALYDGTVEFLKKNQDLHLGKTLSQADRQKIKTPILWYEERVIDGKKVLVPQVILPPASREKYVIPLGTIEAVDSVKLKARDVYNSGQLISQGLIKIDADTFRNERRGYNAIERGKSVRKLLDDVPVVDAGQIEITTDGDLINLAGKITVRERVRLASLHGDVLNLAAAEDFTTEFTRTKKGLFSSSSSTTIHVGTSYRPGQILSGGTIEIFAREGLVENIGSTIAAEDGIQIVARDGVEQREEASTFTRNGGVSCHMFGCNGSKTQRTITQRARMVSANGDIAVEVTDGDFVSQGSDVIAWQGAVTLDANNVHFKTAAFEELNQHFKSGWKGLTYSSIKTSWNDFTAEVPRRLCQLDRHPRNGRRCRRKLHRSTRPKTSPSAPVATSTLTACSWQNSEKSKAGPSGSRSPVPASSTPSRKAKARPVLSMPWRIPSPCSPPSNG